MLFSIVDWLSPDRHANLLVSLPVLYAYGAFLLSCVSLYFSACLAFTQTRGDLMPRFLIASAVVLWQAYISFTLPGVLGFLNWKSVIGLQFFLTCLLFLVASTSKKKWAVNAGNETQLSRYLFVFLFFYLCQAYYRSNDFYQFFSGNTPIFTGGEFYKYHANSIMRFSQEGEIWTLLGFTELLLLTYESIIGALALPLRSVGVFFYFPFLFAFIFAAAATALIDLFAQSQQRPQTARIAAALLLAFLVEAIIHVVLVTAKNDFAVLALNFAAFVFYLPALLQLAARRGPQSISYFLASALFFGLGAGMRPSTLLLAAAAGVIYLAIYVWMTGIKNLTRAPTLFILLGGLIMLVPVSPWLARAYYLRELYFDPEFKNSLELFWDVRIWRVLLPFESPFYASWPERSVILARLFFWLIGFFSWMLAVLLIIRTYFRRSGEPMMMIFAALITVLLLIDLFLVPGGFNLFRRNESGDFYLFNMDGRYYLTFIVASVFLLFFTLMGPQQRSFPFNAQPAAHSSLLPGFIAIVLPAFLSFVGVRAIIWEASSHRGFSQEQIAAAQFAEQLEASQKIGVVFQRSAPLIAGKFWKHAGVRIILPPLGASVDEVSQAVNDAICGRSFYGKIDYFYIAPEKLDEKYEGHLRRLDLLNELFERHPAVEKVFEDKAMNVRYYKWVRPC